MNRRQFLSAGSGFAGMCALGGCAGFIAERSGIKLAMAGYTLNGFKTDEALDFCAKHGFSRLCVKDFHLPFNSTGKEIDLFKRKCADRGITPYAVGPMNIYSAEEAKKRFDYASRLGVDILVGIPAERGGDGKTRSSRRMCEAVSQLAAQYDIRFAIHNHGRNPKTGNPMLYPAPPETWELIKDLDPRMGLCVDWAYTYADGLDCVEVAQKYISRIFDGHVRCLSDITNGSSGINPAGRKFDYDDIFAALRRLGYNGCLGLELANAFPDNPQWIDESREYFEGLI